MCVRAHACVRACTHVCARVCARVVFLNALSVALLTSAYLVIFKTQKHRQSLDFSI